MHTLWQNLSPETTVVITPNNRLALELREQYDNKQKEMGKTTWQSVLIMPLASWLLHISNNSANKQVILLNANQELFIWQQIITTSNYNNGLTDLSWLAQNAKQAWDLLHKWQLPFSQLANFDIEITAAFLEWSEKFKSYCEEKGFFDTARLPNLLIQNLKEKSLDIQLKTWVLVGFDQIPPQIKTFLTTFTEHGYQVNFIDPNQKNVLDAKYIGCIDNTEEILTMARWARAIWVNNPQCNIGCIAPKLNLLRDQIERIFSEVFPEKNTFNISLGKPLTSFPIIQTALKLIHLSFSNTISLTNALDLLRTPFIAGAETEIFTRAQCEKTLRSTKQLKFTRTKFLGYVGENAILINALEKTFAITTSHRQKSYLPSQWVPIFFALLQACGWPGERNLSSTEYQLVQRLQELLQEFTTLDLVSSNLSFSEARELLTLQLHKTIFQPEHKPTPINILGVLEAAGLNFDHLWLLGMDQGTWPSAPKPNPLLPVQLQKKYNLPHASAEQELEFAKTLTARFLRSSDTIVCSYVTSADERELKISPLLANIKEIKNEELDLSPFISRLEKIYAARDLETYIADQAPPVFTENTFIDKKTTKLRGGSKILKLQALCPFRAFVECRLGAEKLDEPQLGLSKIDRGTLIHAILEKIWQTLNGEQKQLCQLDDPALEQLISTKTLESLTALQLPTTQENKNLLQLEETCLQKLLQNWLKSEKQRPPFLITNTEQSTNIELGNMQLTLRLDRIDRLADGSLVIIDYKTGKNLTNYKDWFNERPEDPQLPLYCITAQEPISGLIFAHVNLHKMGFSGITANSQEIDGVKSLDQLPKRDCDLAPTADWNEMRNIWRNTLEKLAEDFLSGQAQVDPKNKEKTCERCGLRTLCRVENFII
ncbi:MAG: hypothetical protein A2X78_01595 [Gammaproteobacteria bacterium GWE2_37_16]|nr:MAG: hypothetical protein A2X78_01595 [Gammaproteobacteria bacterium GWE2_37_16]